MTQLDQFLDTPKPAFREKPLIKWLRGITIAVEVLLWLICGMALLFRMESWEGTTEMFIVAFTFLAGFYLLFTFFVTWARGWAQILGGVAVGCAFSLRFLGAEFVMEAWSGGQEMLILSIVTGGIAALTTLFFLIKNGQAGGRTRFYWNVLIRFALIFLVA